MYQSRSKWWRDAILSFFQGSLSFPADSFRFICPNISGKRYLCTYNAELYMIIEDLDNVKRLIAEKEGGQVEFKETTGQLERGMETLCAFLNGNGGTVLFGVNDKGKIIGQEVSDKTKRDMADAINRLEPVTMVQISYAPLPDSEKKVIIFRVEESKFNRPFCYKGRPYMRVESATTTMPQTTYNDLLLQRDGNRTFRKQESELTTLGYQRGIEDCQVRYRMRSFAGRYRY